ncbi:MAG: hypothetical protein NZ651_03625 [Candidatus Bipolaricaulota bacterium]|nr:hypothetical protein [Candidatus Bipolaricaulota bacterium]MDW8126845.1 hypothetical protein [Candidatus Bipolaricaulota bacterium]
MRSMVVLGLVVIAFGGWAQLVAVAPALDRFGSGLANLEFGLAEMLETKLREAGYSVIPARALESWRLSQGGLLRDVNTWKAAAADLGASYLILPVLETLSGASFSLTLGPLVLEAVSTSCTMHAALWDPRGNEEIARFSASATGQGQLVPSFRFFLSIPWDVCAPALRTNKSTYLQGEPVLIGYRDPNPPHSFYLIIRSLMDPTLFWVSGVLTSSESAPCVRWGWDQVCDARQAQPGEYVAELYQTPATLLASVAFTIEAGFPAWGLELRLGTPEFGTTAWYQALSAALNTLVSQILQLLPKPSA